MRRMLVSRISRRVLAEHHIALAKSLKSKREGDCSPVDHVGIIHLELCVKNSIEKCASILRSRPYDVDQDFTEGVTCEAEWSDIIVDGHEGTKFAYIREHLECVLNVVRFLNNKLTILMCRYVIFELLKNVGRSLSWMFVS